MGRDDGCGGAASRPSVGGLVPRAQAGAAVADQPRPVSRLGRGSHAAANRVETVAPSLPVISPAVPVGAGLGRRRRERRAQRVGRTRVLFPCPALAPGGAVRLRSATAAVSDPSRPAASAARHRAGIRRRRWPASPSTVRWPPWTATWCGSSRGCTASWTLSRERRCSGASNS